MSNAKKIAGEYFKTHPKVDKFFITSDGQAFFTPQDATNHGKTLKDVSVVKVTREGDDEDIFDDTKSKVVYVDKEDTDKIEGLRQHEHVKVIVTDDGSSLREAQAQIEKEHSADIVRDNDGVLTNTQEAELIDEAKLARAPNDAEVTSPDVAKAAKEVVKEVAKVAKPAAAKKAVVKK